MTFALSFLAAGTGVAAAIYGAALLAMIFRREWREAASCIWIALIPAGIYALSWRFLPMENWLILPGVFAAVVGTITFVMVLRNGV